MKLYKPRCNTTARFKNFSMRVIEDWNKMPGELVDVTSVNMFKNRLDKHWTDMGLQKAEQPIIYKYKYETILS
jgi:hypothetical protein